MGRLVDRHAQEAGSEIGAVVTSQNAGSVQEIANQLAGHDVAIDFSRGAAVLTHVKACALAGVPLVEGTTGWKEEAEARRVITEHDGALVYGANFSVGVNVFYRIVANAASLFAAVEGYAPFIEEAHHARKVDAPSGTALRLRDLMGKTAGGQEIPIASTRAGHIPGTHRVGFDSAADQIMLTHTARSRDGFAAGALVAAKWIVGRKGVYEFSEVMDEILGSTK
jgi:4-hydroxy-tetrahydrodipicolinate reductase